jgi:2'-5' RNA ligase
VRLFFAVPTSRRVKETVRDAVRAFPVPDPPWRWIPPENYHLTVKFLGEVREDTVPSVREAAARAAARVSRFRITFESFGAFPSLARPRVIFFAVSEGAEGLIKLASLVDRETERAGFARERRPHRAHLTLARIKRRLPPGLREALEAVPSLPEATSQTVERFVLMQSHLSRAGARYEEIGTFPLGGSL